MFTSILILILFLPVAFLPLVLNTFFSSDELSEMGICLGISQTRQECDSINAVCKSQSSTKSHSGKDASPLWDVSKHSSLSTNMSA